MAESGPTLLLVDDSEVNLDMLSRRLRRKGFVVLTASSGQAALRVVSSEPVDLMVLDLMMPEMDGIEVLRRLRSQNQTPPIPVIMATAKTEATDMVAALDHGADDYVTKPIEIDVLVARIRALLRRRAMAAPTAPIAAPVPPVATPDTPVKPSLIVEPITLPLSSSDATGPVHFSGGSAEPPSPPTSYIGPGTLLDGKYQIEGVIGSGGFGVVYKALHVGQKTAVAVKVLHSHLLSSEATLRRFRIEGISGCRIKHPNAVAILDANSTPSGIPYLVMEYLEGPTLDAERRVQGTLPFPRLAAIISQVCDVLILAHATGIIHRDIKPANILLVQEGEVEVVKVLDFGLAKLLEGNEPGVTTSMDRLVGTPQFMAPERLLGKPSDGRSDVYSLGATLYLCLTGWLPFGHNEDSMVSQALKQVSTSPLLIQRLRPDLPDELASLVMSMLGRRRSARPELAEIKERLSQIASSWQEQWPPVIHRAAASSLELDNTPNLLSEPKAQKQQD